MFIYLGLAVFFVLLGWLFDVERDAVSRKRYLLVCFFLLFLLMGLRSPQVGNDTEQFYNAYTALGEMSWADYTQQRYEWGFFVFCKLLYRIWPYPQALILVTSGIFCVSVACFLYRYSENVALGCVLFLLLNLIAAYINLMRQTLALCVMLAAVGRLMKRQPGKAAVLILTASLFHRSALVCLLFLPISRLKFQRWFWLFFIPLAALCFWQYSRIFALAVKLLGKYEGYAGTVYASSNYFGMLLQTLVCLSILAYGIWKRGAERDSEAAGGGLTEDFQLYMLSCCLFCYIVGMRMYILTRVVPYFSVYYLTWVGKAAPFRRWENVSAFEGVRLMKKAYPLEPVALCAAAAAYFLVIHLFRPQWHGLVPYQFFWQL